MWSDYNVFLYCNPRKRRYVSTTSDFYANLTVVDHPMFTIALFERIQVQWFIMHFSS